MDRYRVGVVIPAFNESASIAQVIKMVGKHGIPIIVDDGSSDGTGDIARAAGAELVIHDSNRGYDEALESGFNHAHGIGCDLVITLDADGQHDPEIIPRFLRELESGSDVVIGIRSRRQRLAEHLFAWISIWRWRIKDPLCGMKGYRMSVYNELGHFDSYNSIGTELAIYAARKGYRISQIKIHTAERPDKPRFGSGLTANLILLRSLGLAILDEFPLRKNRVSR